LYYGVLDTGLDWHFRIAATPQERHRFIEQESGNEMTRWRTLTTGWLGVRAEYFLMMKTVVVAPSAAPKRIAVGMIQCSFEVR
jgi:hypothetical protein